MAESFQKKESIKKNLSRKKVKAGKKLDRKTNNNKGKGLDAMIAYVDAYGRPTDTPPETRTQGTPQSYRS